MSTYQTTVATDPSNASYHEIRDTSGTSNNLTSQFSGTPGMLVASTDNVAIYLVVSIATIGVVFVVTLLCIKNKTSSTTKNQVFELIEHRSGRWVDNPEYVSTDTSSSQSIEEEDQMLPEWMRTRKEMIYDMSCITRGKELGHGEFGTVFQAQIRLQNAV